MPIKVQIPTPLRQHTEGKDTVETKGTSVKDVLDDLGRQFPGITQRLFDGAAKPKKQVWLDGADADTNDQAALLRLTARVFGEIAGPGAQTLWR